MYDPCTVAHEVRGLFTIWHIDPEKDGTDDSCGWFMRGRHIDQAKLKKVEQDFNFNMTRFDKVSWFKPDGSPNLSTIAIVVSMFRIAANIHFGHWSRRAERFLRNNCFEIIRFAENATDSLVDGIEERYGCDGKTQAERARNYASTIYSWICRADRPWWKHPRWHFWHWRIQFHPWQNLKRRWWDKCCVCGKRGFTGAAIGNWEGDKIWHSACDEKMRKPENAVMKHNPGYVQDQFMC